jgi:hypothetical protein
VSAIQRAALGGDEDGGHSRGPQDGEQFRLRMRHPDAGAGHAEELAVIEGGERHRQRSAPEKSMQGP